jgi:RNA polymerase sigma-70 factor (ECF subfamily)
MTPLLAQRSRVDRSFERLYRRFATDVYRYAYGVLRNQADAEDVTQTTFMNAYRAFERGEQPQAPLNWLIAIAHNVCRQRFRAAARRPQEVELDYDVADRIVAESDDGPTAEDIRRALGHLAFNQRAAIVMRELEGRSYAEIGEVLGLSVSAVETLIFRARRSLREQLEGSLTCDQAELAISKQLDGRLSRADKAQLRAHLRECSECATFARRQRAQRTALKAFGAVPLPSSLAGLFGGGGATIGIGIAAKAAAVVAVAGAVGAGGYDLHRELQAPAPSPVKVAAAAPAKGHVATTAARAASPAAPAVVERGARPRHHAAAHPRASHGAAVGLVGDRPEKAKQAGHPQATGPGKQLGQTHRAAAGKQPATAKKKAHKHQPVRTQVFPAAGISVGKDVPSSLPPGPCRPRAPGSISQEEPLCRRGGSSRLHIR